MTRLFTALLPVALALVCATAAAQEFSAIISPPRFEERSKPGQTYRNVIEVMNPSSRSARFGVSTADWGLDASFTPVFSEALVPGSCRTWVGIEASEITVPAGERRRFRFEVAVPADAPKGECRFAIMFEGEPQAPRQGMPLPMSGRIGVIVYLAVGDAAPRLEIMQARTATLQPGVVVPALSIRNSGDMHGRLEGFLAGVDAAGKRVVLVPDNSPILVGATRDIALYPQPEEGTEAAPPLTFPIRIKGRLDTDGQRVDVDTTVAQ